MLYKYVVKFHLLADNRRVDEIAYCSDTEPCSKNRALLRLEMLWGDTKDLYSASQWMHLLRDAVDRLKHSIRRAEIAAEELPFSITFEYLGKTYTLAACVEAGSGHFRTVDVAPA